MPTIKTADRAMDRQGAALLAILLGGTALTMVLVQWFDRLLWQQLIACAGLVVTFGVLLWRAVRMTRAFKCPDCGGAVGPILPTDGRRGTPLLRHCRACDILWKIGTAGES